MRHQDPLWLPELNGATMPAVTDPWNHDFKRRDLVILNQNKFAIIISDAISINTLHNFNGSGAGFQQLNLESADSYTEVKGYVVLELISMKETFIYAGEITFVYNEEEKKMDSWRFYDNATYLIPHVLGILKIAYPDKKFEVTEVT